MVSLDQIRLLESMVSKAVAVIDKLTAENTTLKARLSEYQSRIDDLEVMISEFKTDQGEIEEGINNALLRLRGLEAMTDTLGEKLKDQPAPVVAPAAFVPKSEPLPVHATYTAPVESQDDILIDPELDTEESASSPQLDIF
jgi:TolA-binding protein